jgi:hypothetical protein
MEVSPGFDPAEDIRLVFAPDGEMAGYVEVWTTAKPLSTRGSGDASIPIMKTLGVGTWMLHWAENAPASPQVCT